MAIAVLTGSALDNAVAEAVNSTLQWELLRNNHFQTREQTRHAVAAWIDDYNSQRRHSTNRGGFAAAVIPASAAPGYGAAPDGAAARSRGAQQHLSKPKPYKQSLHAFRGLPTPKKFAVSIYYLKSLF
jgi:hypothetical protein